MRCPHCTVTIHANWSAQQILMGASPIGWLVRNARCPACEQYIFEIAEVPVSDDGWKMVHPTFPTRGPAPTQVPENIRQDYAEACNVLSISPKASAALSRRCLQAILHGNGYKARDLAAEIELLLQVTGTKAIPDSLRTTVDAIRNFGNFSAHRPACIGRRKEGSA